MVDVTDKQSTQRQAIAEARVLMSKACLKMIVDGKHDKGDVFAVARIAGIQAAKKCADLIPMCHPLMLTGVSVDLHADIEQSIVVIRTRCKLSGKTGVEMEALTAASVAALTVYDMCKSVDKGMVIQTVQLCQKHGGKSGSWERQ